MGNFFERDIGQEKMQHIAADALAKLDDGELFLEARISEALNYDDNKLSNASYNISSGFGLRGVVGEAVAYAHSSIINEDSLNKAASIVKTARNWAGTNSVQLDQGVTNHHQLYPKINPLEELEFSSMVNLLEEINSYLRSKNPYVRQVSAAIYGEWQFVKIIRNDEIYDDIRPLVRVNITVTLEKNGRMEYGYYGMGGRSSYHDFTNQQKWQSAANEALRQALVNLEAKPAPAGEMKLVLGPGWPGVLLHEAVGHGLEGDFNRKELSAFSGLIGKQVAAKGVTVIDDGTIHSRRGSLNIDDEGTATARNILIEDGVLRNYMQDRQNGRLMGAKSTGNGRRQSYAHLPMPRMTNSFMIGGNSNQEEMIKSVKRGLYAVNFGGGQVDITSGKFVFSTSEAYLIEDGKVTSPVKGATLIGSGIEVMKKIIAIGDDLKLDEGVGTCGKNGQTVPVGVGQPSLLIDSITVGGTEI